MFNRREAQVSAVNQAAAGPVLKPRTRPAQPVHVAQLAEALLRISTVEAVTGLSRSTIYSKLAEKQFPQPVRLGTRCTRFRAADVTAWLAAQTA
jgi:prophage regulatory protein